MAIDVAILRQAGAGVHRQLRGVSNGRMSVCLLFVLIVGRFVVLMRPCVGVEGVQFLRELQVRHRPAMPKGRGLTYLWRSCLSKSAETGMTVDWSRRDKYGTHPSSHARRAAAMPSHIIWSPMAQSPGSRRLRLRFARERGMCCLVMAKVAMAGNGVHFLSRGIRLPSRSHILEK
jgi:hypothetical protein